MKHLRIGLITAAATFSLLSCDIPFMDNIYDDQSATTETEDVAGTMSYLDCTTYTNWVYVDLRDGTSESLAYNEAEPEEWTIALHRYDLKTNNGVALKTAYTSLAELQADIEAGTYLPALSDFAPDTDGQIIIDMSGMMSGVIGYADSPLNEVLGEWMDVDTSNMPPTYTMHDNVFLVYVGGTLSAMQFTGYSNPYYYDTKGYISFDYVADLGIELGN